MFIDEIIIEISSGRGGNGAVAFHREIHVPRGGPNGADGGKGGDVILTADRSKRTLYDLKFKTRIEAENGTDARGNKRGKDGQNVILKLPVGTLVYDANSGSLLADLSVHGISYVACKGGRGGFGNLHYVSSVRQVPNFAEKGEPGEKRKIRLELKLLADAGLIGLPNAGKSTFLSQISAAKPKIADYPFTTIEPNLGVVSLDDFTFTVADLPGLIEGASEGHGLGYQFLKHTERTRLLVHIVDLFPLDDSSPFQNYQLIEKELQLYSERLWSKPRLIALNKIDLLPDQEAIEKACEPFKQLQHPVFAISAAAGKGIQPILYEVKKILEAEPQDNIPILIPTELSNEKDNTWEVQKTLKGYEIIGRPIERMVAMTDLKNHDALRYLHRKLERAGVIERLRKAGVEDGDTVIIGEYAFDYREDL